MRGWITLMFVALAAAAIARPVEGGAMLCGGVGSDAREQLAAQAEGANLKLEFVAGKRGAYVADVDVKLVSLRDPGHPITTVADGPICYVHVPAGDYRIDATYNGETRSARAIVPEAPPTPVRVAVGFPAPAGEPEPVPTQEERRQARTP